MKLPRDLTGAHLCSRLERMGFTRLRQSGSHVVLQHTNSGETLSVPAHRPLKAGTLRGILRDVQDLTGLSLNEILTQIS